MVRRAFSGNLIYLKEPLSKFRIHSVQGQRTLMAKAKLFFMIAKAIMKFLQSRMFRKEECMNCGKN